MSVFAVSCFAEELDLPPELVDDGRLLYNQKCRACHGANGSGASGPSVTGILPRNVSLAAQGIENMPSVSLDKGDAEAIGAFLMSLAPEEAQKRLELLR